MPAGWSRWNRTGLFVLKWYVTSPITWRDQGTLCGIYSCVIYVPYYFVHSYTICFQPLPKVTLSDCAAYGFCYSAESPFGSPYWHNLFTRQPCSNMPWGDKSNNWLCGSHIVYIEYLPRPCSQNNPFSPNAGPRSFWVRILPASLSWLSQKHLQVDGGLLVSTTVTRFIEPAAETWKCDWSVHIWHKEWSCHTAYWVHIRGKEIEAFMQWLHLDIHVQIF